VLPLYIPVLIFGAGAVEAQTVSVEFDAYLYLLGAFLAVSMFLAPLAASAALRISVE